MENIEEIIKDVIDACYQVHLALVPGYLESVYHHALLHELSLRGIKAVSQQQLDVCYKGCVVGTFEPDIVVEDSLIIELKAISNLTTAHEIQLVNYLTCTGIDYGLLVNFGSPRIEIKRKYRVPAK